MNTYTHHVSLKFNFLTISTWKSSLSYSMWASRCLGLCMCSKERLHWMKNKKNCTSKRSAWILCWHAMLTMWDTNRSIWSLITLLWKEFQRCFFKRWRLKMEMWGREVELGLTKNNSWILTSLTKQLHIFFSFCYIKCGWTLKTSPEC